MKELIERIEGADGPSRELDLAIVEWAIAKRVTGLCGYEGVVNFHPPLWLDRYGPITVSLDAALTLVPEGCAEWNCEKWDTSGVYPKHVLATAWVKGAPRCYAATPALALVAAALRARNGSNTDG